MRRITGGLALTLLVAGLNGPAVGSTKATRQHVEGRIEHGHNIIGLGVDEGGCLFLLERLALAGSKSLNGKLGYGFKVDPKTFGTPFALMPPTGKISGDLDIAFYREAPGYSDAFNTAQRRTFATRVHQGGQQGEYGMVPRGFHHALVCYAELEGQSTAFTYSAGPDERVPRRQRL